MIARIWTGLTRTADADAYRRYMREVALPGYTGVPGNRGVLMLCRPCDGARTEFTMITLWEGLESVMAFAGSDPQRAVFYPLDEQFLVERDLTVRHYDVYGTSGEGLAEPASDAGTSSQ